MKNKIIDIVHEIILEPVVDALRNGGKKLTGTEDVKTVLEKTKKFVQKSGVNPADATVTAGDILAGKTAYGSDGQKLTGTIESKSAQTYTPGTVDQTIAAGQYLAGNQTVKGDANLTAGNIIKGKTIFGVAGTCDAQTFYQCTAVSGNTWSGKKLVMDSAGNYSVSDTVKSGLLCSGFTPEVGGIYLEDSTIKVKYFTWGLMPTDGLVFYAPLASASNTALTGQALVTIGTVTYSNVDGIMCANLTGMDGYISSDGIDIPFASEPRTISYWVRLNADATDYHTSTIWGYGGGGDKQDPGNMYFSHTILPNAFHNLCGYSTWDTSDVYIEHTFSKEKWYHICQTSTDGQTFVTYVDGAMIGSIVHSGLNLPQVGATVFSLGRTGRRTGDGFGNFGFQGNLAGFRAYNKVLSQDEITILSKEFTPTA